MTAELTWSFLKPMDKDDSASPYIQWATSPPGPATRSPAGKPPDMPDLLSPGSAWLNSAVRAALGDEPRKWPELLHLILPDDVRAPSRPESLIAAGGNARQPDYAHSRDKVIMALIDDAVAFAQERFRLPDARSRVDYLWLQGAPHDGANATIPFGRELDRSGVEELLNAYRGGRRGQLIDEEGLYRAAGAIDMGSGAFQSLARRAAHGTAVLDLASGITADSGDRDRMFQSLPDRMDIDPEAYDLALVSLPQSVTADTSGTFAEIFIIIALARLLQYVEDRCHDEKTDYPVIINLSFGLSAGPKDGTSLLDRFIDALENGRRADRPPVRIVMPAGNHRLARSHARLETPLDRAAPELCWHLPPDDTTPSFLEIWSSSLAKRPEAVPFSVTLDPEMLPDAAPLGPVALDTVHELCVGPRCVARAYAQWVPFDPKDPDARGRVRVTLGVPATVPTAPGKPFVPAGHWRLLVESLPDQPGDVWPLDLTIQRDDMIPGFRGGGRQSHFEDAGYVVRNTGGWTVTTDEPGPDGRLPHIRRQGTLNALATAQSTVVVAGCYADTLETVAYSGEGMVRAGVRAPDVSAPAAVSRLRGGIHAAGSRSGSRIGVEGTSVAAPTMSRELAKATRPMTERPKLSGVPLLYRSMTETGPPPVLPVGENVEAYSLDNKITGFTGS